MERKIKSYNMTALFLTWLPMRIVSMTKASDNFREQLMPEINYVNEIACNLARVLPDTSRCVFYMKDCPPTKITGDLTVHLGDPYIARTHAELAVIIDGATNVSAVFIFAGAIDEDLSDLLHEMMSNYPNLWIIHVDKFVSADMTTGKASTNISFNLIERKSIEATADLIDYKNVVFKEIKNRIYLDALQAMVPA